MRLLFTILCLITLSAKAQNPQQMFWQLQTPPAATPHPVLGVSSLHGWYRADSGVVTSGQNVTQWSDLSGKGKHLVLFAGTNPTLSATSTLNGKPVINFSGGQLATNTNSSALDISSTSGDDFTFFIIGQLTFGRGWRTSASADWSVNVIPGSMLVVLNSGGTATQHDVIASNYTRSSSSSYVRRFVIDQSASSTFLQIFDNGISLGSTTAQKTNLRSSGINEFTVGRVNNDTNPYQTGPMYEIIVYNRLLTTEETATIENYLKDKYGINY